MPSVWITVEMFRLWMQAELCKAGSTLNWQNRNRIDSMFCDICNNSATFMKHFCNSTKSHHWLVKIKRFLFCCKFHYLPTVLSAVWTFQIVLWTWILTTQKWSMEETCKLIFCLPNTGLTQKFHLFFPFDIFDVRNIKPAAAMHMSSFIFLEAPHDIFTSLQLSTECVQDRTLKHLDKMSVFCQMCVCGQFHCWFCSVSVLLLSI